MRKPMCGGEAQKERMARRRATPRAQTTASGMTRLGLAG